MKLIIDIAHVHVPARVRFLGGHASPTAASDPEDLSSLCIGV